MCVCVCLPKVGEIPAGFNSLVKYFAHSFSSVFFSSTNVQHEFSVCVCAATLRCKFVAGMPFRAVPYDVSLMALTNVHWLSWNGQFGKYVMYALYTHVELGQFNNTTETCCGSDIFHTQPCSRKNTHANHFPSHTGACILLMCVEEAKYHTRLEPHGKHSSIRSILCMDNTTKTIMYTLISAKVRTKLCWSCQIWIGII